jgi:hypothetical protein
MRVSYLARIDSMLLADRSSASRVTVAAFVTPFAADKINGNVLL